ncbi:hypothetical protein GGS21DRAFT_276640 [Xylaria nigripes]|nr:hypothetical protein GGS21DRAFT_276640 [Xylaria nigripes]
MPRCSKAVRWGDLDERPSTSSGHSRLASRGHSTPKFERAHSRCGAEEAAEARRCELMAQLLPDEELTSTDIDSSVYMKNRYRMGAPWDPDSDDESGYLTDGGKHVMMKKSVSVCGHDAVITYRNALHEVDPFLLSRLREKREKKLAKEHARRIRKGEVNAEKVMEPLLKERLTEARTRFREEARRKSPPQSPSLAQESNQVMRREEARRKSPPQSPSLAQESNQVMRREETRRKSPHEDVVKRSRPLLRRMKRSSRIERLAAEDEDLDLWQRLADEYDEGKTPRRRAL